MLLMSHRSFLKYTLRGIHGVEKSVAAGKQIRITSEFSKHSLHKQIENKKQVTITGSLFRPISHQYSIIVSSH